MSEQIVSGETRARIMIGKFIRKHIFTEDFQTGRLSRQKFNKILNSQIRTYVVPESGLTFYSCQQLSNTIFKTYLETEEYLAYKEFVRQARQSKMTPEQYFNSLMIKRETDRSKINVIGDD